jgi:hypothetical protein
VPSVKPAPERTEEEHKQPAPHHLEPIPEHIGQVLSKPMDSPEARKRQYDSLGPHLSA